MRISGALQVLVALAAVGFASNANAQIEYSAWDLYFDHAGDFHDGLARVSLNDKWGYINNQPSIVVECIYNEASDFHNGHAKVKRNGKWGLLSVSGTEVIACKYDAIGTIDDDLLAPATRGGKRGYVNTKGDEVIPCQYDEILSFNEHLVARARSGGKWGLVSRVSGEIAPCQYDEINDLKDRYYRVRRAGKWGYLNAQGQEVVKCQYDELRDYDGDYSLACYNGKWGFIDKSGKAVIPFESDSPEGMKLINGMTRVTNGGWSGVFSTSGRYVVNPEWDEAVPLSEAIIKVVKRTEGVGAFNMLGNQVLPCKYQEVKYLGNNLIMAMEGGKCGIYETVRGNKVMSPKYDQIEPFSNGLAAACEHGRWGYIDAQGKKVIDFLYSSAEPFNDHGIAVVGNNGTCTLIDNKGRSITPYYYSEIQNFSDGLARAKRDGKWGCIDAQGHEVVECKYDRIGEWDKNTGLALASMGGSKGYLNREGRIVVPCRYDEVGAFDKQNLAQVKQGSYVGLIDADGHEIVPCQYSTIDSFHDDMAMVSKNGKWGYVGRNGMSDIACQYEAAQAFSDGMAAVKRNGKWGYINTSNREVLPFQYTQAGPFGYFLANVNGNSFITADGNVLIDYKPTVNLNEDFINSLQERKYSQVGRFTEGRGPVKRDDKWGFIDVRGKEVISCDYDLVNRFCQKRAAVKQNDKWGYLYINGGVAIPITMDVWDCGEFSEGLACIFVNNNQPMSYYFIDRNGKQVFGGNNMDRDKVLDKNGYLDFNRIPTFDNGECYIPVYGSSQYEVYNTAGERVRTTSTPPQTTKKSNGYQLFKVIDQYEQEKFGVKDSNGNVVIEAKYDEIKTDADGQPSILCGVVPVLLLEPTQGDAREWWGYANLQGHDTFTSSVLYRIKHAYESLGSTPAAPAPKPAASNDHEDDEDDEEANEIDAPAPAAPARNTHRSQRASGSASPNLINSSEETGVGTLTAYRASGTFSVQNKEENTGRVIFSKRFSSGTLICDSNDPGFTFTPYENKGYKYEGQWDGQQGECLLGVDNFSRETIDYDEMLVEEVGDGCLTFESNRGNQYKVRIFKGNPDDYNNHSGLIESNYSEKYFIVATVPSRSKNSEPVTIITSVPVEGKHLKLYGNNQSKSNSNYCGLLFESYRSDNPGNPVDSNGNLLASLTQVEGSSNFLSVAYVRSEHKLYVNGDWYYLKRK